MGMTNGEMIQKVFNCEVCEPIFENDIIHVIFADKKDSAIGFDWSWWSAEYKEPTTKNDLAVDCISRADAIHAVSEALKRTFVEYEDTANQVIGKLPSVTPQEPRKGKWLSRWYAGHDLHFHVCSECNEEFSCDMETGISIDNYHYCPNCGADMREVKE